MSTPSRAWDSIWKVYFIRFGNQMFSFLIFLSASLSKRAIVKIDRILIVPASLLLTLSTISCRCWQWLSCMNWLLLLHLVIFIVKTWKHLPWICKNFSTSETFSFKSLTISQEFHLYLRFSGQFWFIFFCLTIRVVVCSNAACFYKKWLFFIFFENTFCA